MESTPPPPPTSSKDSFVSAFDELLDEYIRQHPVHTEALTPAEVRFAAGKFLLSKSKRIGVIAWPGDGAARLAAILLVLFVEGLASSQSSVLGIATPELYTLMERAVRDGGVSRAELLRHTTVVDRVGNAVLLAQSDELRRLWLEQPSARDGSGSSLPSVSEDEAEPLPQRLAISGAGTTSSAGATSVAGAMSSAGASSGAGAISGAGATSGATASGAANATRQQGGVQPPPLLDPAAMRSSSACWSRALGGELHVEPCLLLGAALFALGLGLWFLSERTQLVPFAPGIVVRTIRLLPPTVYSSCAMAGFVSRRRASNPLL